MPVVAAAAANALITRPEVCSIDKVRFDPPTSMLKSGHYKWNSIQNISCDANCNVSNQFTCLLLQVLKYKSLHDKDSKKGNIQGKNGKSPEATYDEAITVMCLHSSPGLNIGMILIKTQGNCDKVFDSNLKACDYRDGFGPGCFVVVMSPNYVTSTFGGDEKGVPILEYSGPLFKVNTLKTKMTIPDIVHNDSVEKMSGLYYRNVKIVVINTDVVSSVCRGYLCDSLGLNPNSTKVHTGCPCYTPVTELSRVLLMFNLFV
jgi:hypothetical protein